jgi:hypothetical protein
MKGYIARKNQDWGLLKDYSEAFSVVKLLRQYLEVLT